MREDRGAVACTDARYALKATATADGIPRPPLPQGRHVCLQPVSLREVFVASTRHARRQFSMSLRSPGAKKVGAVLKVYKSLGIAKQFFIKLF